MVSCPKSVIAPTAAAGPLSVAKVSSTWTKVCATVSRMASARSRAGRVLVSRSTVTAAPPDWPRVGGTAICASQRGYVHRALCPSNREYNAFDSLYTEWCAFSLRETTMATAQPADRGGRGARARIQTAATILFHRDRIRPHRSGAANRTRQRVEMRVLTALLRMNELVE